MTIARRDLLAAGLLAGGFALTASAQGDFPSRPVRFVVPFGPGSGTDTSARYFARKFQDMTGQPVVVDNKPGGNGFIAVRQVLDAPADGYTVFIGSNSTLAVNVALFKKLPYDPASDFAPLSMMMRAPAVLVVPPSSPYQSLAQLVAAAKAEPGKLNYGSGSAGYQLMAELFNDMAAVDTRQVPFKSAAEALTAVASGTVDLSFADITAALELVKGGRVRALAVAADRRAGALPMVPTTAEAGLAGYAASVWVAATVSARTPPATAEKLATLFTQIERLPETREFYARLGAETMAGGAEEMKSFQAQDIAQWKRIAVKARIEQE
ncbi:tripartite tricarboxylate transporter substrate binding protein [Xylophilus sp. GOD-11R]|uniref:Bug family tripartite tricarboxylate transporter substrate binding protein n=1 Tax=Xylophilus sp. GOD-11R TaxID=3089814 RepID=UPI00298C7770|nr:tripartite tricarboxylate transporter substrate binding protein [Xylophilus sp. GOD-11R]WPB58396.1 tripartite tricarboxylate transporter substrate binding protein [Xylophilus sp. GOD-11R]